MIKTSHIKDQNKVLITGSAGFIGYHLCLRLLADGWNVLGLDGMTDYYDISLKKNRNSILERNKNFRFFNTRLEKKRALEAVFSDFNPSIVVHLAAQAGVRYSISHPETYVDSNIIGTFNLMEVLKEQKCHHFLMASTSSVYGGNTKTPFREKDASDFPMSFYSATKKSTENFSHYYSHLFGIPTTCFRFFTVYGPWGRPDMALFKFTEKILKEEPIDVFNHGKMSRDFTYIDDIVESIVRLFKVIPSIPANRISQPVSDSISPVAPWRTVNIGGSNPIELEKFIGILEEKIGKKAKKRYLGMQQGDVENTQADISLLKDLTNFIPQTSVDKGIENFLNWYLEYNKLGMQ